MSTFSRLWSRLALVGLSAVLLACTDEAPGISSGPRLPKASPTPEQTATSPSPAPSTSPSPTPAPTLKSLMLVPSEVSLSSDPAATNRGTNLAVVATLSNDQQISTSVTWSVSPAGLVTVNDWGYVSALSGAPSGTATVTAASGSIQATASVHVTAKLLTVDSVALSSPALTLYAPASDGLNTADLPTTAQLGAVVTMSDASTTSAVTWSSSNPQVARIDSTGLVTTVGAGSALLSATSTQDASKAASCNLTVKAQGLVDVTVE